MEGLMIFISILFIVFGILQIILFFKIWGMTNDVKSIAKTIEELNPTTESHFDELIYDASMHIYCGDTESARKCLLKGKFCLLEAMKDDDYDAYLQSQYQKRIDKIDELISTIK